ncbi:hypothetical protein FNV43_RR07086 [Rhamnella rubrinervis]|uniref:RING-type domain-containing protein n=1 Tax=Rhamnella rubrinervis TaxID=2594499 RepID=A0A8K0MM18_9ROSA|nr:hypothetical protein FNV43_RR07086 [Rhamnella rubrinervis]
MKHKTQQTTKKAATAPASASASASKSAAEAFLIHLISAIGLAVSFWAARNVYSINLISHPSPTLRLIWVVQCPIVILLYSRYRQNRQHCSYWKAVGRGMLGLPVGALVIAFGAIAFGAPIGIKYLPRTINWSLMMSLFTVVPTAAVFGSSWTDWQRIFAYTKPVEIVDYMISLPAHGAIIGAWFGAWPMPLDWERPWQEWPICVSYGAIAGYLVAMVASFGFILVRGSCFLSCVRGASSEPTEPEPEPVAPASSGTKPASRNHEAAESAESRLSSELKALTPGAFGQTWGHVDPTTEPFKISLTALKAPKPPNSSTALSLPLPSSPSPTLNTATQRHVIVTYRHCTVFLAIIKYKIMANDSLKAEDKPPGSTCPLQWNELGFPVVNNEFVNSSGIVNPAGANNPNTCTSIPFPPLPRGEMCVTPQYYTNEMSLSGLMTDLSNLIHPYNPKYVHEALHGKDEEPVLSFPSPEGTNGLVLDFPCPGGNMNAFRQHHTLDYPVAPDNVISVAAHVNTLQNPYTIDQFVSNSGDSASSLQMINQNGEVNGTSIGRPQIIRNFPNPGGNTPVLCHTADNEEMGMNNDIWRSAIQSIFPEEFDGSFLTLGIVDNTETLSKSNSFGRNVGSNNERVVLPQPIYGQSQNHSLETAKTSSSESSMIFPSIGITGSTSLSDQSGQEVPAAIMSRSSQNSGVSSGHSLKRSAIQPSLSTNCDHRKKTRSPSAVSSIPTLSHNSSSLPIVSGTAMTAVAPDALSFPPLPQTASVLPPLPQTASPFSPHAANTWFPPQPWTTSFPPQFTPVPPQACNSPLFPHQAWNPPPFPPQAWNSLPLPPQTRNSHPLLRQPQITSSLPPQTRNSHPLLRQPQITSSLPPQNRNSHALLRQPQITSSFQPQSQTAQRPPLRPRTAQRPPLRPQTAPTQPPRTAPPQQLRPRTPPGVLPLPQTAPGIHLKWKGFDEASQPIGQNCFLCKRDISFTPEGPVSLPTVPPQVAVLPCGHAFHDHCLQLITPPDHLENPPCIPCAVGELAAFQVLLLIFVSSMENHNINRRNVDVALDGFSPVSSARIDWKSRKRSASGRNIDKVIEDTGNKTLDKQEESPTEEKMQDSSTELPVLSERRKALFEPLEPINGQRLSAESLLPPPDFDSASYPRGWLIGKKRKLVNVDVVESMRRIAVQEMNRKDREINGLNEQLEEDSRCLEHLQLQLLQERSKRAEVERENVMLQDQINMLMNMLQENDPIDDEGADEP